MRAHASPASMAAHQLIPFPPTRFFNACLQSLKLRSVELWAIFGEVSLNLHVGVPVPRNCPPVEPWVARDGALREGKQVQTIFASFFDKLW